MAGRELCLIVVLVALVSFSLGQNGPDCQGNVGGFRYNLSALVQATNGAESSARDNNGNTFFYRPCNVVMEPDCKSNNPPDDRPAVCMKDNRKFPLFHDVGSQNNVNWSQRRGAPANMGFLLTFIGGEEDRTADIEFICNPNAGVGVFATNNPAEQPTHSFHLKWETAYACPTGNSGQVCCSYVNSDVVLLKNGVRDTLHNCALNDRRCPFNLGTYYYTGNRTISSCGECGSPQRSCCFYVDPRHQSTVVTNCVTSDACPLSYVYDGSTLKNVGSTLADDCNDCYLA